MICIDREKLKSNIHRRVTDDLKSGRIGGAAIEVRQSGEVLYKECFGTTVPGGGEKVDETTIFRLASMTKPITAVASMILAERGMLSLSDDISKYVPGFSDMFIAEIDRDGKIINAGAAKNKIKVADLMSHTSGIGCDKAGEIQGGAMTASDKSSVDKMVEYYSHQELAFEPASKEAYSPVAAFEVLTFIIEKITGSDYNEFLKENIFIPCDMKDTTFKPSQEQWNRVIAMHDRADGKSTVGKTTYGCVFEDFPPTNNLGGAGLISTIKDYSNFAQMLLNKGVFDGKRIVSEESIRLISTPAVAESMQPGSERWGLGVRVITGENTLPLNAYGWSGAYGTHFWVDPENEICAVYMKNSRYDGGAGAVTAVNFEKDVYSSTAI